MSTPEGSSLRVSDVRFPVTTLGPGRRMVLWVQGCPLACPGCMSRDTWDPAGGRPVGVAELAGLWHRAADAGCDGLTISGGEPLDQAEGLAELLALRPGASDVLVYTGYTTDEAREKGRAVFDFADAVITGRFEVANPTRLIWRGSANQDLLPLTALGRERYGPFIEFAPQRGQVEVCADGRVIGVPRSGDLKRLEDGLRDQGIVPRAVTWRPTRWKEDS